MAVTFRAAGALAANATTTTLAVVAPTSIATNDLLVAAIMNKDNQVVSAPTTAWTKFVESNNGTVQRVTLAWKWGTTGDSGATFNFTKPTDNNLLFCGVISVWRGASTSGPIDAATPTVSLNSTSDTVTYATFDPASTAVHVVAIGVYNNDLTTAGAISGTNPTFTNRWDLETGVGTDGSIFGKSGDSDGAATGARSHTTTSSADDKSIGVLLGIVPPGSTGAPAADTTPVLGMLLGVGV